MITRPELRFRSGNQLQQLGQSLALAKLLKMGQPRLTFNVANSFSGGLTINKGTVVSAVDGSLGTGNISLTAGNITLTLNGASNNIADTATLSYVNQRIRSTLN